MSERVERAIEAALEARTGRDCLFMPSGRFAIHLAFRVLLAPGDRILMSPLEDDTVFFGALAAGLCPVMAPVAPEDGNIRVDAVSDATWSTLAAVLTGNTYGLPDRIPELVGLCARRGIRLIEDAAHAIETDVAGRAVGSFGVASVFSLSKHFPGRGGVLALDRSLDRRQVIRERDRLMLHRPLQGRTLAAGRTLARSALEAMRLWPTLERARQALRPVRPAPWRVPLRAHALELAAASRDLGRFDSWMGTAYPDYRMPQRSSHLRRTLAHLRDMSHDRDHRVAAVERLRTLDAVAPAVRTGASLPLLRVPLLVEDRDEVALELRRRRINVYFVYAPPLDDYAGRAFCEPSNEPEAARWWADHILPVDPHDAERLLGLVGRNEVRLTPAPSPPV